MESPIVEKHKNVDKCGYLQKLSQKGFPYLSQWKRRYFVLTGDKVYSYDKADAHGSDKSGGVIDLRYFNQIAEAEPKDCKKTSNVFIITTEDKSGLLDPGRHVLSADSREEMVDWMERLRMTLELIKNNNKPPDQIAPDAKSVKTVQTCNSENEFTSQETQPTQKDILNPASPSFTNAEIHSRMVKNPDNGLPAIKTKPLDNITRTRVKGPSGRRIPRSRQTMQPRSNSLNILNHDDGHSSRSQYIIESEEKNGRKLNNESYPSLAYFYSDEDSSDDNAAENCLASLPPMALNFNPMPISQRSSVHFSEDFAPIEDNSSPLTPETILMARNNMTAYNSLGRPVGRASGGSSPAMDALDDLLMNQSIQQVDVVEDTASDTSDSNTFKVNAHLEVDDCVSTSTTRFEDNYQDVEHFSSELKHLQRHLTTIDTRTASLEENHTLVADVAAEVGKIRNDVHSLSSSVKLYSAELTKIKNEFADNMQKMDLTHRQSLATLSQAEKSKEEYELSKRNYDVLICDLFNFFAEVKDSFVTFEQPPETNEEVGPGAKNKPESARSSKSKEKSSSKADHSNKLSGYQSFFQRPSNLLHGLASKSHIFSLGEKDNQKSVKQKKDNKTLAKNYLSKSDKNLLDCRTPDSKKKKTKGDTKLSSSSMPLQKQIQSKIKMSKVSNSKLSTDDIPMMDDSILPDDYLTKSNNSLQIKTGISHVSINVQCPSPKLGCHSNESSPIVGCNSNESLLNRHVQLRKHQSRLSEPSIVNSLEGQSSPKTRSLIYQRNPLPSSPLLRNNLNCHTPREKLTVQNCFGRQSSLPETQDFMNPRKPDVSRYGIIRQTSSPNLPLKRQSSSGNFPILRQNSLGIVPEEGFSRQSSLMSVPEERLIVDQTIPSSVSGSTASFQLSPSSSGSVNDFSNLAGRTECQSDLAIAGSYDQHTNTRQLPSISEFYLGIDSATTSSLKKKQKISRINMQL